MLGGHHATTHRTGEGAAVLLCPAGDTALAETVAAHECAAVCAVAEADGTFVFVVIRVRPYSAFLRTSFRVLYWIYNYSCHRDRCMHGP